MSTTTPTQKEAVDASAELSDTEQRADDCDCNGGEHTICFECYREGAEFQGRDWEPLDELPIVGGGA